MIITPLLTDEAVLAELGSRMTAARIARRLTQAQFAEAAGVSKRTVERIEAGADTQLTNLIRCLRALGKLESLERLLPPQLPNPVDVLERRGAIRQRARRRLKKPEGEAGWKWGEDR
ncbi:MAG: helix-turn-helix domain-containing protein [Hyphomonadaceae bacterium]